MFVIIARNPLSLYVSFYPLLMLLFTEEQAIQLFGSGSESKVGFFCGG